MPLEGEFLHEQVDVSVHLEAVKIISITLQPHQQPTERYVCCSET